MRKVEISFSRTFVMHTTIEIVVPNDIKDEQIKDYLIENDFYEKQIENNLHQEELNVIDEYWRYDVYKIDKLIEGGEL